MKPGRRRRVGRPRAAERGDGREHRGVMLGAVYDVISREGADQASMREIAAAARVSTGTLNHHFTNKKQLLIEALRAAYHLPPDWESYAGSPAAQLRRIMLSFAMSATGNRWWRFWINYLALSTRDPDMQQEQSRRYERQLRFWTRLVQDGIAAGEFRRQPDAEATARRLLTQAHGLVVLQLIQPGASMRKHARAEIEALVAGLRRQGSSAPSRLHAPAAA
ncbi:MAG TPA: TetR family transcriptional regulator C-terminal domain-containing protein [Burkholderiales bacterium]|nr:TetR family transcriptional regulator C-terminal domain-containing protein [Burkholderiales bacterium]